MPGFGDFFVKGSIGEQLLIWGVLNNLITTLLGPALAVLEQSENTDFPVSPLSPAELATAVNRNFLDQGAAGLEASKSGLTAERFQTLVHLAGDAPGPGELVEALRRNIIPLVSDGGESVSFQNGIRQGNLDNKWTDMFVQLGVEPPSSAEVIEALVQSQLSAADALTRYTEAGGDPSWFQTAYGSAGDAPGPSELLEMLRRGIITTGATGPDSLTFEQGIAEGRTRNKWTPKILQLLTYVPPARTVTALLREGAITEAQALHYFQESGLDATLAAVYVAAASHHATAAARELSQSEIIALYEDKLITAAEATADLVALRFPVTDAQLLLALADKRQAASSVKSAVTRLQHLYLAGTNSLTVTESSLHSLGLTDDNVSNLIATWNLERTARVKELTEAQVVAAWFYGGFGVNVAPASIGIAVARLETIGYSQADALLLLTARLHSVVTMAGVAP